MDGVCQTCWQSVGLLSCTTWAGAQPGLIIGELQSLVSLRMLDRILSYCHVLYWKDKSKSTPAQPEFPWRLSLRLWLVLEWTVARSQMAAKLCLVDKSFFFCFFFKGFSRLTAHLWGDVTKTVITEYPECFFFTYSCLFFMLTNIVPGCHCFGPLKGGEIKNTPSIDLAFFFYSTDRLTMDW